ncbi:MAG: hypothetical protein ACI3VP_00020 [Oscillospiraceae bacterium]
MKKNSFLWMAALLVIAVLLVACAPAESKQSEKKGVRTFKGTEYYVIDLAGADMDRYFDTIGSVNKVCVTMVDINGSSGERYEGTVCYATVRQGGWLAWKMEDGKVAYIPASCGEDKVQLIACDFASYHGSMTLEEAKEYISWLK